MQLITSLAHLRGKRVNVGGNDYDVDDKGVARNVSDADAATLLESFNAWTMFGAQTAEPAPSKEPEQGEVKAVKAEVKDSADAKDIAEEEKIEGDAEADDVLNKLGDLTSDLGGPSSGRKKKKG